MSHHGTLSNEFPGWYIQFQADVLLQLPRPDALSKDVADGWHNNRGAMKKALRQTLCPPETPTPSAKPCIHMQAVNTIRANPERYINPEELAEWKSLTDAAVREMARRLKITPEQALAFLEEQAPVTLRAIASYLHRIAEISLSAHLKLSNEILSTK